MTEHETTAGVQEILDTKDRKYGVALTTNDDLELLLSIFEATRPDWSNLIETVSQSDVPRNPASLHGWLAEQHTVDFLEARANSDLFKDVCTVVNLDGKRTKNYDFIKKTANKYTLSDDKDQEFSAYYAVAEYDALAIIGGLPTVFEVKAPKSRPEGNRVGFNKYLKPHYVRRYFPPLQEVFQTDTFGLVIVTLPELINTDSTPQKSPNQEDIINEGGRIIAINTTFKELKDNAGKIKFPPIKPPKIVWSSGK
jgi:hypothetical protein